ncbi:hypothetical protein IRZ71_06315 [Flavobacterium sp. ANB]|uniref:hypothetical protein n=1 Tax=unclassified Flavobacterium TaxID=196869 RepID=UPI0012B8D0C5|nr:MULTISPECIES: hypothetical protein [unclassified Flavobacterium]MBF4515946.1 hypothetical protein [Flavobacterium sp. ANB]MTD68948.1 hypothetical protein [Flavobacterium sp. LC2016-13]
MKKLFAIILFSALPYFSFAQKLKEFYNVRNAEFGYSYVLPVTMSKEIIGTTKDYQISINNSEDLTYRIELFSENYFYRKDKAAELEKYYERIISGKHPELLDSKIVRKEFNLDKNYFILVGNKGANFFIWKTYVSEVPVSGELVCNTMIFRSSKSKNKAIGNKLISEFGGIK